MLLRSINRKHFFVQEIETERSDEEKNKRKEERMERRRKRGDKITLTVSEEKIGIKFVQPNM